MNAPLPPPPVPFTTCGQAEQAWEHGEIHPGSLIDGALALADGTRCPVGLAPWWQSWWVAAGTVLLLAVCIGLALCRSSEHGGS